MMEIREEKISDYRTTENVVREAFWNVYSPGCCEHYLVHRMRKSPDFVPELNLVAVEDESVVGHVAHVKAIIEGDDGKRYEVLTLGPIAVLPQYQCRGIGAALIAEAKRRAHKAGYRAVLLCGDSEYYSGQGFEAAEKYGIRNAENMFVDALQICGLYEGALDHLAGVYYESGIYNVDEEAVREFDEAFPVKEAITGTPSQQRFLEIAARCRPYEKAVQDGKDNRIGTF